MALAKKQAAEQLEEAFAELRRDPSRPVHVHVDDLEVELRVVGTPPPEKRLGDFLAEGGGWQGESAEDLLRRIRQARDAGTTADVP